MPESVPRKLIVALCLASTAVSPMAQEPHQTGLSGFGPGFAENQNQALIVPNASPGMRVPVRTTAVAPLGMVIMKGYRNAHCTERVTQAPGEGTPTTSATSAALLGTPQTPVEDGGLAAGGLMPGGGELKLRDRLVERLGQLSVTAARAALQAAEKSADRAAQFQELFGVPLPPLTRSFTVVTNPMQPGYNLWGGVPIWVDEGQRTQLNMGQEVTITLALDCLTPAQIDAAIAEAKRVYGAVIAAMESGAAKAR